MPSLEEDDHPSVNVDSLCVIERRRKRKKGKSKKVERDTRPCKRSKKAVQLEGNVDTNCNWGFRNSPQKHGEEDGRVGKQKTNRPSTQQQYLH